MNKVIKVIIDIFLTVIILILSLYLILKITNKIGLYEVKTGSMETGIHKGDYIVVVKSNKYKKGDVVTYKKDGYYITHRIVKIKEDIVITKGDANNTEDEEIGVSSIVGKYIYKSNILNFIIDYKYMFAGMLIILFLLSNYINKE